MKFKALILFLSVLAFESPAQADGVKMDSLTVNGTIYTNCTVRQLNPAQVAISMESGGAMVAISNLPPDLQSRFNFNPTNAAAFLEEASRKNSLARANEAEQAKKLAEEQASQLPPMLVFIHKQISELRTQMINLNREENLHIRDYNLRLAAGQVTPYDRKVERDHHNQFLKQMADWNKSMANLQLQELHTRELYHLPLSGPLTKGTPKAR
jgi:hypothetical protein